MFSRLLIAATLVVVLDQHGVPVQGPALPFIPAGAGPAGTGRVQTAPLRDKLSSQEFGRIVERLSEPNGYFDTDNLISNEASYLHVLGKLRRMQVSGGAYIGVGPDQNFSYIAQVRPRIAFIIDIRRDNLVEHLLFKALFSIARNRAEYLSMLVGRPLPEPVKNWDDKSIQQIVDQLDRTPGQRTFSSATAPLIRERVRSCGITLSAEELQTLEHIREAFFESGLDLKFTSRNRSARSYYPTYRELLLERDLTGRQSNYLSAEEDFRFLKSLEENNLVIPVVGDLAGGHALSAIGQLISQRGEHVSAFYTSNVEFYVMRQERFENFVANLKKLPYDSRSVIIRSYFTGSYGYSHPQAVPGYYSSQLLQTIESLVKESESGGYQSYLDLVSKHSLELK
jgi:hypothetical protein